MRRLPLLLERVGVRRIKSTSYTPLIPTPSTPLRTGFSLKGEGAGIDAFVDQVIEGMAANRGSSWLMHLLCRLINECIYTCVGELIVRSK